MKPISSVAIRALLIGLGAFSLAEARADSHVSLGLSVGIPLPHGYAEVSVGHDHYYYHRGIFYRPGRHGYEVVRAPRGCIVRELPPMYSRVYFGSTLYYRYDNVYYQSCPEGYVVVDPPSTVVVQVPAPAATATSPAAGPAKDNDYQSVWVGDVEYLFRDGQFFKRTADGLVWASAPLGAITKTLPADSRSVWYEDVEYIDCEEIYFRKTPDGYKVVEAPWKKNEPAPAPAK